MSCMTCYLHEKSHYNSLYVTKFTKNLIELAFFLVLPCYPYDSFVLVFPTGLIIICDSPFWGCPQNAGVLEVHGGQGPCSSSAQAGKTSWKTAGHSQWVVGFSRMFWWRKTRSCWSWEKHVWWLDEIFEQSSPTNCEFGILQSSFALDPRLNRWFLERVTAVVFCLNGYLAIRDWIGLPHGDVHRGTPKWMVYKGKSWNIPFKMDDLGVPLFFGDPHMSH